MKSVVVDVNVCDNMYHLISIVSPHCSKMETPHDQEIVVTDLAVKPQLGLDAILLRPEKTDWLSPRVCDTHHTIADRFIDGSLSRIAWS